MSNINLRRKTILVTGMSGFIDSNFLECEAMKKRMGSTSINENKLVRSNYRFHYAFVESFANIWIAIRKACF